MATGFEAVDRNDIGAVTLRRQGMAYRRALVNDLDAVRLQPGNDRLGVVAGRFDDTHIALDDRVDPAVIVHVIGGQ
ncbi:hypothetical protein D3C80_1962230 [compost metagenome]